MLTKIELANFKAWEGTGPVKLAPITCFLGANSSGKTSLIQSLLLLKQTTESPDRRQVLDLGSDSTSIDLGTYNDIVHGHQESINVELSLDWDNPKPIQVQDLLRQARKQRSMLISSTEVGVRTKISISGNHASVEDLEYRVGEASFRLTRRAANAKEPGYDLASDDYEFARTPMRPWPLPAPSRFYGFPDQVRLYFQNATFLSDLELAFEEACSRILYLGPLREDPKRQYIFSGGAPSDVGRRGERAIDALISSTNENKMISRGFRRGKKRITREPLKPIESVIAEWLQELGLIHSFSLEALDDRQTLYRVNLRRDPYSPPVLITDVGFGVSQVLPVLVLLAYAEEGSTVILEQPEIHLHPAVQARLADLVIETALARNIQVIIETHSEHFLTRLQRRLAEKQLKRGLIFTPEDVQLYFCDFQDGRSVLSELDLDLFGNIKNWPENFFGDLMGESVSMMEAAARRDEIG